MMVPRYCVPGNHHTRNSRHPQRGIEPTVMRGPERRRRTDFGLRQAFLGKQAFPRQTRLSSGNLLFLRKSGAAAGIPARHPLAKRGVLGQ
jgi:hypothetical protein